MNNDKVNAIVNLLQDESSEVCQMMDAQLKQMSMDELMELCEKSREIDIEISLHIKEIRKAMSYDFFVAELEEKVSKDDLDLESMAIFLSRFIDHTLKVEDVKSQLNELTQRCRDYLDKHFDVDRGEALARFFGKEEGFTGNKKQYYAIGNSSIYCTMVNKKALPITLSVLYIIVGNRLGIDVKGIAVPAHFIIGVYSNDDVKFFNPFDNGKVMTIDNCRALARRAGYPFSEEMLEPVDERPIFLRMLNNLKYIYSREKKSTEGKAVSRLLKIWTERVFRQV